MFDLLIEPPELDDLPFPGLASPKSAEEPKSFLAQFRTKERSKKRTRADARSSDVDPVKVQRAINKVHAFYRDHLEVLSCIVVPMTSRQGGLSLRLLNWFVTVECKRNPVRYYLDERGQRCAERPAHRAVLVDVWKSYCAEKEKYGKAAFAPFRRHDRVTLAFEDDGKPLTPPRPGFSTTICQLNFFRWAWIWAVIDHCREQQVELAKRMQEYKHARRARKAAAAY